MSGTIGQVLLPALADEGHGIIRLKTGKASSPEDFPWNPMAPIDPAMVSGFDAVIHLAGENIFGRWSEAKRTRIRESRVTGTRNLAQALARSPQPPKVMLSASAIGYYGNRGDELLDESSSPGAGFLAEGARDWEGVTGHAAVVGIRVVRMRIGVVLSRRAGALAKMLTPFRLGLGGKLGSGRQWLSWIAVADAVGAILHCLHTESLSGPVNLVAPNPVTNEEFGRTLARTLHRPSFMTTPEFAAKMIFGPELAAETALSSQRVQPARLLATGFMFSFPELQAALADLLK